MRFTVKNPLILYKMSMVMVGICVVMMAMYTLFEPQRQLGMYIVVIMLFVIPFAVAGIWAKRYRIIVKDTTITVQKGLAWKPFTIDISEITRVVCIISNTRVGVNKNMKIYTGSGKRFNVETHMITSDKMFDFINKNVQEERIQTKIINFVSE